MIITERVKVTYKGSPEKLLDFIHSYFKKNKFSVLRFFIEKTSGSSLYLAVSRVK